MPSLTSLRKGEGFLPICRTRARFGKLAAMASQHFTPAAQRAFAAATAWTSGNDCDELEPPELLLGLLAETECRAAALLDRARHRSRGRVATLARRDGRSPRWHSADGQLSQAACCQSLRRPRIACGSILVRWSWQPNICCWACWRLSTKRAVGSSSAALSVDALEADIHRWYGHRPGPLAVDVLELRIEGDRSDGANLADQDVGDEANQAAHQPSPSLSQRERGLVARLQGWATPDLLCRVSQAVGPSPYPLPGGEGSSEPSPCCGSSTPRRIGPARGCASSRTTLRHGARRSAS